MVVTNEGFKKSPSCREDYGITGCVRRLGILEAAVDSNGTVVADEGAQWVQRT